MILQIKRAFLLVIGIASIVWTAQAFAVTPSNVVVSDNKLQASITLSPSIKLDVVVEFEKSLGLNANSIDIEAFLVPVNDMSVLSRLSSNDVELHPDFPVVLSITPKQDKGFSFEGLASVEIYTKAIDYQPGMPAKIFTAHAGGNFEDITSMVSAGSLRARGNTGRFSDFIIVLDERSLKVDVETKLARVNQILSDNQNTLSGVLMNQLQTATNAISAAVSFDNYDQALVLNDQLIQVIEGLNGSQIEDVWRSSNDIVNAKGELLSVLNSLRYRLRL